MLTFHYEPDAVKAAANLTERLTEELQADRRVLWLVPGGSNIALSVAIMKALPAGKLANLTCMLTDERYGKPGHTDSNWQQLAEAGFMDRHVRFLTTLAPDLTIEDTCRQFAEVAEAAMDQADVIIGQFGIGGDGHIAGVLPRTAAVTDDADNLVVGYDGGTYQRITLTPPALRRIDAAYAFVYGESKQAALSRLKAENLPLAEQPSQILKELPEAHVYTDQQIGVN